MSQNQQVAEMSSTERPTREAAAEIKRAVRERYAAAAATDACACGGTEPTTREVETHVQARRLDLGCGNPLPFACIVPGDVVLDLGSGSGEEVLRAARMTGPRGKAIGVDMTDEMLDLARRNLEVSGLANVEFLKGEIEALPLPDASVDVIVSNCVLNLSPDKASAFGEAFRVLRPGGRFVVADVVIPGETEPESAWRADAAAWSRCESGAMSEAAYERGLREAGFADVVLERLTTYLPLAVSGATGGGCCSSAPDAADESGCCGAAGASGVAVTSGSAVSSDATGTAGAGGATGANALAGSSGATSVAPRRPELASDLIRARKPEA